MKTTKKTDVFKRAKYQLLRIMEKFLDLDYIDSKNDVIKNFRKEFLHKTSPFGSLTEQQIWEEDFFQNKNKSDKYHARLTEIAEKYKFTSSAEIEALEIYLLRNEVNGFVDSSNIKDVTNRRWITRVWEGAPLTRKIISEIKKGKNYEDISADYNSGKNETFTELNHEVKTSKLRKVISRAFKKKGKNKLNLLMGKR